MSIRILTRASNILLPLALLAFALGWWQLQRMEGKKNLTGDFESAQYQALSGSINDLDLYSRLVVTGRFDTRRHVLLDNMVYAGRAGVHVLTPFQTAAGEVILVNRGWKPIPADRSSLPGIETPAGEVTIRGILAPPPENRQTLGAPDVLKQNEWPQLVTYLEIDTVAQALQSDLPGRVLWLDANDATGFKDRQWSPSAMTPQQHQAYAVQWFALTLAALVFWAVLLWRDIRKP